MVFIVLHNCIHLLTLRSLNFSQFLYYKSEIAKKYDYLYTHIKELLLSDILEFLKFTGKNHVTTNLINVKNVIILFAIHELCKL